MRVLLCMLIAVMASDFELQVADVVGSYRSEPHDDFSYSALQLTHTLGKKKAMTFSLEHYQGGDCGGTSTVYTGRWQLQNDSTLVLLPEKEDEYLNDATVQPQEWHRKYVGKPITVQLLRDGSRVVGLRLNDRRYLQRVQGQ